MINIVNEIEVLTGTLELEKQLRAAVDVELRNGVNDGPMGTAHEEALEQVVTAARLLVDKVREDEFPEE